MSFRGLDRAQKSFNNKVNEAVQKIADDAAQTLIVSSPVDTGRFRGNWLAANETVNGNTNQSGQPGASFGMTMTAREQANVRAIKKAKAGKDIFISNNLVYAESLEAGRSKMAPGGVLFVGVMRVAAKWRRRGGTI